MLYLDYLFFKPLTELIELPDEELIQRKQQARTLFLCIEHLLTLKRETKQQEIRS